MTNKNKRSDTGPTRPKIIFGLVGPVGTDLDLIIKILKENLILYGYPDESIDHLKLSKFLNPATVSEDKNNRKDEKSDEFKRIRGLMEAGSNLREKTSGDILALCAIAKIYDSGASATSVKNNAYILDSLKHPDEIETLRIVYGNSFHVISAYAPHEHRANTLAEKLKNKNHQSNKEKFRNEAEELIFTDAAEGEEIGKKHGQQTRNTFPLGDLFVDARSDQAARKSIARYLEIIFHYPYHTPTRDEFCMFYAKSASLRSADMSRQVGAAIATHEGEIIATGCNEIPKAGGGLYWPEDANDSRDFQLGYESSAKIKTQILYEIFHRFRDNFGTLNKRNNEAPNKCDTESLIKSINYILKDKEKELTDFMKGTQIRNLLEYGRAVHAEMAALSEAARRGVPVKGATLYTTTFPCHICARHIIAAGINRVVFVQPYSKSLANDLYRDSIVENPDYGTNGVVVFDSFIGVAPNRYMELFTAGKREDGDGKTIQWSTIQWSGKNANSNISDNMKKAHKIKVKTEIIAEIEMIVNKLVIIISPEKNEENSGQKDEVPQDFFDEDKYSELKIIINEAKTKLKKCERLLLKNTRRNPVTLTSKTSQKINPS